MALVNHAKREINAKIVVCGPSSAGKATLLKAICAKLPAEERGPLRSMALQTDKMLFFDFTHPEGGDHDSYSIRFHVYTLTGTVSHENSWKMVLKGVDGIAFVADSDPTRQSANQVAMNQLRGALAAHGKSINDLSVVALCTKRDLSGAVPTEGIAASLDIDSLPLLPVYPVTGEGVSDSLGTIVSGIVADLQKLGLSLQKPAREFLNPEPVTIIPENRPEPTVAEPTPIEISVPTPLENPGQPSLVISGTPEIDPSGAIRIPVKISCCGSETVLHLSISLVG